MAHDDERDNAEPEWYGEAIGPRFLDKLLLAIIDAHSEPSNAPASDAQRRRHRLRAAKEALLGETSPEGRPAVSDDEILRWIGCQHYKDLANRNARLLMKMPAGKKPRSARKLVDEAAVVFKLTDSDQERIRKKFTSQKDKWLDDAKYHDDIPETIEFQSLESIREILGRNGIAMKLREVPNRPS